MSQGPARDAPLTSLHELSALLVREREVLHLVLEALAGADGSEARELLLHSITSLELHRAIATRAVALELGMDREPTLRELAERAPAAWTSPLEEHLAALRSLARELGALVRPSVVDLPRDGNVISLPDPSRGLQRSLLEFLA